MADAVACVTGGFGAVGRAGPCPVCACGEQEGFQGGLGKPENQGDRGENHARHGHAPEDVAVVLAAVVVVPVSMAVLIVELMGMSFRPGKEHEEDEPEAVVGGHQGSQEPREKPELVGMTRQHSEDGFLAEKAGEGEYAREAQGADGHADHGDRELSAPLPANDTKVVGVILVDEDARTEEEQSLESGMGGQVEDPGEVTARRQGHDHEATG